MHKLSAFWQMLSVGLLAVSECGAWLWHLTKASATNGAITKEVCLTPRTPM